MAKQLTSITLNKDILKSSIDTVGYTITGQEQAVFNLQIKDSSTPNKFYNFKTSTFTNTFTSENTLSDVEIIGKKYQGFISIPASSNGNSYKFLVFPNRHFDTDGDLLTATVTQESDITVRFSTASDQGDSNFEGIGSFAGARTGFDNPVFTGSSNTVSNRTLTTSLSLADGADSVALGYKCSFDKAKGGNFIADSLQPVESDFFITFTKKTNGTGSSATEVVLSNEGSDTGVDNLVVGMALVQIASSTKGSGSLGVLTFPTITAINTETLTVTLSSAQSWSDDDDIIFRAYGNDLIRKSVGLTFTQQLKVFPTDNSGNIGALTQLTITAATDTAVTVSALLGVSAGSRLQGPGIDSTAVTGGFRNDITGITTGTRVLTMRGNQNDVADNTKVFVTGSSNYFLVQGDITITKFPSIATDVFFDIDRAVILSTTS
jgi:hypothetical protein